MLANRIELPQKPLAIDDPKVLGVLLDTWAKLSADDERNLGFEQAAAALHLGDTQRRQLKAAGATDLKGIAAALRAAPELERHDAEVEALRIIYKNRKIVPVRLSLVLQVQYTHPDKFVASKVANLFVDEYITYNSRLRIEDSMKAVESLL